MSPVRMSGALLERLGEPASAQLHEILETHKRESTEAVMSHCADRFERRLVEETSKLQGDVAQVRGEMRTGFADVRGEMQTGFADVRGEMQTGFADLRGEMQTGLAGLRGEMQTGLADLRGETRTGFATLRQEIAADRFELLKWAFGFWIVQLLGVAGVIGTLINSTRR